MRARSWTSCCSRSSASASSPSARPSALDVVVGGVEHANEDRRPDGDVRLLLTSWRRSRAGSSRRPPRPRSRRTAAATRSSRCGSATCGSTRRSTGCSCGATPAGRWPPTRSATSRTTSGARGHEDRGSSDADALPALKYVTELQLSQVPEREERRPRSRRPRGAMRPRTPSGSSRSRGRPRRVTRFDWGASSTGTCAASPSSRSASPTAIRDEARRQRRALEIVSGSVTHNNLDYLVRMHRANPRAFDSITGSASTRTTGSATTSGTPFVGGRADLRLDTASPREYAGSLLQALRLPRGAGPLRARAGGGACASGDLRGFARALAGKKVWITEFGIGTKVLGAFNAPIAEYTRFIRPRGGVGLAAGHAAAVWEDLWEAFLDQVDRLPGRQPGRRRCCSTRCARRACPASTCTTTTAATWPSSTTTERHGWTRRRSPASAACSRRSRAADPRPSGAAPAPAGAAPAALARHPVVARRRSTPRRCSRSRSASCWPGWPPSTGPAPARSSTAAASSAVHARAGGGLRANRRAGESPDRRLRPVRGGAVHGGPLLRGRGAPGRRQLPRRVRPRDGAVADMLEVHEGDLGASAGTGGRSRCCSSTSRRRGR